MGGTMGLRTAEHAARSLGVTDAELARLVERADLRTLPLAGGGWVTTDGHLADLLRRRQGKAPRRRRSRSKTGRGGVALSTSQSGPAGSPAVAPAPIATVPAPLTVPAPAAEPRRTVPIDVRPDIEPNERLDMRAAAARLGVAHGDVVKLAERGRLSATRLGREWITTSRDVDAYRARHGTVRRADAA